MTPHLTLVLHDTDTVISKLQSTSDKLFNSFKNNQMKANPEKCHLLLSLKTPTKSLFGDSSIKSSTKETLLVILIDSELRFDEHFSLICTKVSGEINALGSTANFFMSHGKHYLIMKTFIGSQFNYCP